MLKCSPSKAIRVARMVLCLYGGMQQAAAAGATAVVAAGRREASRGTQMLMPCGADPDALKLLASGKEGCFT